MKPRLILFGLALAVVVQTFSPVLAADPMALPEKVVDVRYKKCPGMGGEPQENVAWMKDGKVYHFCCSGCIAGFEKDFESKVKTLVDPTEVELKVANAAEKCPVTGKAIDPKVFQVKGNTISFYCCKDCVGKEGSEKKPDQPKDEKGNAPAEGASHKH